MSDHATQTLARFGAAIARLMHAAEGNDLDALDVQNAATESGVLVWVRMAEPCGTACVCAGLAKFPLDCLVAPDPIAARTHQLTSTAKDALSAAP